MSQQKLEQQPPLIRTKISIPFLPPEFVRRPILTKRISQGAQGPLTLVSAPAGFGKTKLLAEWASQNSLSIAWLTLDDEDNELNRFFRYIVNAFQDYNLLFGQETLDFIQSIKSSGLEMGLTLLINDISTLPKDIVLVLDDYHVIEESAIHQSLNFLVKHSPHHLHLVIASRTEPPLDLALFRAKGWVTDLGEKELRFNGEEIALFCKQTMRLQLQPDTVRNLEKRTEGWIAALQLAAISIRNQPDQTIFLDSFHGDAHYLVDFLAEEVLYRQTEEVRKFLLDTSILDVLNGPLCEAVVDADSHPGYGAVMLNRLERANLFISPIDQKYEWFRYHQLFADFLRHVLLEANPAQVSVLHRRAALWFEQHGNLGEAFKHALATGDDEWLAAQIERNFDTVIKSGELLSLSRWIGKLPDEIIHKHPFLALAYAWGLIAAYQLDDAEFWLEDLQKSLDHIESQKDGEVFLDPEDIDQIREIRGGLAICRSMLALINGDFRQAAEYSRVALDHVRINNPFIHSMVSLEDSVQLILSGDTSKAIKALRETMHIAQRANNLFVLVISTYLLAEMQVLAGNLSLALVILQKAQLMALNPDGYPLPIAGIIDIGIGDILRERNDLKGSEEYLERGCQRTEDWWSVSSLDGITSLARLRQSLGYVEGSQALLAEASRLALSTESSQWDDLNVSILAVRLALQRNDLATALKWWAKSGIDVENTMIPLEDYPYHVYENLQLTQTRIQLAIGQEHRDRIKIQQVVDILQDMLPTAERFERVTSTIEMLVLKALAEYALNEIDQAVKTLLSALALGEAEDFRRIYLDEGQPIAELLVQCQSAQRESSSHLPSLAYIGRLLRSVRRNLGGTSQSSPGTGDGRYERATVTREDGLPTSLSAREMEVLTLIAEGKTNKEISAELYVALNTVKRHAYNIYNKLGVKKRTQAVSIARQLGLIT